MIFALAESIIEPLAEFSRPAIDWHALSPELTLLGVGVLVTVLDILYKERGKQIMLVITGLGFLAALIPIITLAVDGVASEPRILFNGAYVVDGFSLILKAMFLIAGYVVVLLSSQYVADGDYWENEYYGLLSASLLGMLVMTSARDLITIFVALELLSIPIYMLATWNKRNPKGNEAGIKYYLTGVFASGIMLYGMSLIFGASGSTILKDIFSSPDFLRSESSAFVVLGIVFSLSAFAFKVSGFPFHTWAPDTYEGAPTPVTAFLSVASKAAGFVALMQLIVVGFYGREDVYAPLMWFLAAASMTGGNIIALRQKNIVRLMAYSGVAQAGFMLAPLAVVGVSTTSADQGISSIIAYLVIYTAMNLGVFGIILVVARRTRSGDVKSYNGLFSVAPTMAVLMTIFLMSLAGVPPLGGWYAKFSIFRALISANTVSGYVLAGVAAVNTVIALGYYGRLAARMWFEKPAEELEIVGGASEIGSSENAEVENGSDVSVENAYEKQIVGVKQTIKAPFSLGIALGITLIATLLFGIVPGTLTHFTTVSLF